MKSQLITLNFVMKLSKLILMLMPILMGVALLTLLERKVLGYMQFRKGPNIVGLVGMLQPFADGMKLFIKETFKPFLANKFMFHFSPLSFLFMMLLLWSVAFLPESSLNINLSFLFIMSVSSLAVYPLLTAGWSSNSKYALLGAVRGVAQMMSYEVSLGLIILPMIIMMGGWGLILINELSYLNLNFIFLCLPLFFMWFISLLAEANRSPFDLAEGESELVSGYKVEYSGVPFAFFFIGEYANMIFMKTISVIMFLGGFIFIKNVLISLLLSLKMKLFIFFFLWVRGVLPRVRYDQLMMLMWKEFLPLTLCLLTVYYLIMILFKALPSFY